LIEVVFHSEQSVGIEASPISGLHVEVVDVSGGGCVVSSPVSVLLGEDADDIQVLGASGLAIFSVGPVLLGNLLVLEVYDSLLEKTVQPVERHRSHHEVVLLSHLETLGSLIHV
jgi:hypothetical protein